MNRKIKNSNGYTLGSVRKWHSFMESFIKILLIIGAISILTAIATIMIWA